MASWNCSPGKKKTEKLNNSKKLIKNYSINSVNTFHAFQRNLKVNLPASDRIKVALTAHCSFLIVLQLAWHISLPNAF
jgi:hypothetical protein